MASHEAPKPLTDDWHTPPEVIAAFPEFDLDPCCGEQQTTRTAQRMIHWPTNGLFVPWDGVVWLNPPYGAGSIDPWLERMANHEDGIALLPARVEVAWFHRWVWGRATGVFFFLNRLHFINATTGHRMRAAFPSVMASYGDRCREWLRDTSLPGVFLAMEPVNEDLPLFFTEAS